MYGTRGVRYGFFPRGFLQDQASQGVERATSTHCGSDSTRDSPMPSEEQFQLKISSDLTGFTFCDSIHFLYTNNYNIIYNNYYNIIYIIISCSVQ